MFVVANRGSRVENLGLVEHRVCATCHAVRPFYLIRHYRYYGFYWLFNFVTTEQYWHACGTCNQGPFLGSKPPAPHLAPQLSAGHSGVKARPIPLWRRYGLFLPIAFAAVVSLIVAVVSLLVPDHGLTVPGLRLDAAHSQLANPDHVVPAYTIEPGPGIYLDAHELAAATLMRETRPSVAYLLVDNTPWYSVAWPASSTLAELSSNTLERQNGSPPFLGFHDGDRFTIAVTGSEFKVLGLDAPPVRILWTGRLRVERTHS